MRSNSLDVVGDTLAVAYQSKAASRPPVSGLFDISTENRSSSRTDCSGCTSCAGARVLLWTASYPHRQACRISSRATPDDQFYRIVDVRNPSKPAELGRWWLPGTREGDDAPPPQRLERKFDMGFRAHNTNVYPERPDRAYVGYIDGGAVILDIADKSRPKQVAHWRHSPPFNGFTHTVLPLLGRNLLIVSDSACGRRPSFGRSWCGCWMRAMRNPVPLSTLPAPPTRSSRQARRGGRALGAHNLHENQPVPRLWRSGAQYVAEQLL
jgi:hypothetical protein